MNGYRSTSPRAQRRRGVRVGRPILAAGVALVAGLSIAACGGSSASHPTAQTGESTARYASCIRAHGIPEYPDSGDVRETGTDPATVTVSGTPVSAKVMTAAQDKCLKYNAQYKQLIDQPRFSAAEIATKQAQSIADSKCMRAHGVSNYPDFRVEPGPKGRGLSYKVVGKAPGAYNWTVLDAAAKACHYGEGAGG